MMGNIYTFSKRIESRDGVCKTVSPPESKDDETLRTLLSHSVKDLSWCGQTICNFICQSNFHEKAIGGVRHHAKADLFTTAISRAPFTGFTRHDGSFKEEEVISAVISYDNMITSSFESLTGIGISSDRASKPCWDSENNVPVLWDVIQRN